MELVCTEQCVLIRKLTDSETVTSEMPLRRLSSGHGGRNRKNSMSTKLLNISTLEDLNFSITKVSVLTPLVLEEVMLLWFITHLPKPTIRILPMTWFISLIQEDSTWMAPLMSPEPSTLESQLKKKKIHTLECFSEIWISREFNGPKHPKLQEVTLTFWQEDICGRSIKIICMELGMEWAII